MDMEEQLAIMKGVRVGVRDMNFAMLYFTVYVSEGAAAGQHLDWDDARHLIEKNMVADVRDLEGKPCWVKCEGNIIRFLRLANFD